MDAQHPQRELIDGLHALADWLEFHPQQGFAGELGINVFPDDLAAAIRGAGHVTKEASGNYFWFRKTFGPKVYLDFTKQRDQVCERVVVGRKTVTKPVYAVPEQIGTEEFVEEIVEWRCPDSVLRAAEAHPEPAPF